MEPATSRFQAMARITELMRAAAGRELIDVRAAIDEVEQLAAGFPDDPQVRALAEAAQAGLGLATGSAMTDVSTLRRSFDTLGQLTGGNSEMAAMAELMPGYLDALQAHRNGDTATALTLFDTMLKRSAVLPETNPLRQATTEIEPMLALLRSLSDGDGAGHGEHLEAVRHLANRPGIGGAERALLLNLGGGGALRQGTQKDPARIDASVADLREAVRLTPERHPEHVLHLTSLALGLTQRSETTGSLDDAAEAITVLERACELAGGPAHPHWSFANDMLAELRRRVGDRSPSRAAALDALRGRAWQVLLQPDPGSARAVAREAAREAMAVAARCLTDHEPADALRALDAGRGLMLFAATELRDPCTRLIEAGEPELAERWRTEEHPSGRLRESVIEVLSRDSDLLDPPDLAEIQDALTRLGADALVYLVPADSPAPGWAVIAPAEGPPRYLTLPHLVIDEGTEIERYLAAAATRDVGPAHAGADFGDRLNALCTWAWKAAIGSVVQPYLADTPQRAPRLVIIPMGDLARVPWQVARRPDGRYLVELAAVSQAASARMLCRSAAAEPVRTTTAGLVVADPETGRATADLLSARIEAYAVRQSFYPGATYVGRLPNGSVNGSGAGTPEDVRNWLRADGGHTGAMLHIATHGVVDTTADRASSRLVLAGGDLSAEELIRVLDSDRHPIGLVVLAGCHTGQSIHGYDEAYSLGTMFLAAGARSVLSTQWSIPDRDTSLLMYMFHHFLRTERRPVWDALRRAQLWMLDDGREPPAGMPPALRRMLADTDPTRLVSWAGFVHWGQ